MRADQLLGVLVRELRGDRRAPVTAVHGEGSVAEDVAHQSHPQRRGGAHRDAGLRQRARQRVSRQRGHDHVEGVGRIAAVRLRIAQRTDHAVEVPERPRPAMRQHQRQRVRRRAPGMDVVDRHVVEHDAVVLPLIERILERSEIELVAPVGEGLLHPLFVRRRSASRRCRSHRATACAPIGRGDPRRLRR